ncbi:hypothetical protein SAMN02927924_03088 [Sphingobium faniae]|nr:hypothetical protein SAMN02927924_03088 [Sphingobium faniae]
MAEACHGYPAQRIAILILVTFTALPDRYLIGLLIEPAPP